MKIVVLDGGLLNPGDLSWEPLHALGEVTVYDTTPADKAVKRLRDADIAITNKVAFSEDLLAHCPRLKCIAVTATGYNIIDLEAVRARQIVVTNVPTYGTATVAQFTTALLLALCNRVGEHDADVHAGGWSKSESWCYWLQPMIELAGKRVGIIGYGRIGQAFGAIAQAMGMTVLAHSARSRPLPESAQLRYVDLDTLYAKADVISLHCPLTPQTKGMINREALAKMKRSALLLNASRGDLINEADLAAALNEGRIAGAAVDVLSSEPPGADNPLLSAKNCIITPHIAWASVDARGRILATTVENVRAFITGEPQNRVD
ncbi:D-2-hydroxyacid dehydrogenase [Kosakonia cowanii]|uniref:D-2-hydroxyacid dehydrogenase n=1 Tax=Kosakonia cowanii TaxID=208223 RepID=UPI0025A989A3|nr:D-2-hydroxyacid dehydrogenase [Kosakonia cowanii]MDM9617809.1 D-2-hydroxyacid dehydrogenase [Kosakonia cowanii]MDP4562866.1 D-2-hydroxyacid dehydrogenase [Kosakonia cowanii]